MEKKKANRLRKNRVEVCFDDNEIEIIKNNIKKGNVKSQSEYLRTMALFGKIIMLDYPQLSETYTELSRIGNNINQMVRIGNKTGTLYKGDIMEIKEDIEKLTDIYDKIFWKINDIYEVIQNSKFDEIMKLMHKKIY